MWSTYFLRRWPPPWLPIVPTITFPHCISGRRPLPSVATAESLSASVSPVEGTHTADRYADAIANGLMCQEDVSIDMSESDAPKLQTINNFQKDFFLESSFTKGRMMCGTQFLRGPSFQRQLPICFQLWPLRAWANCCKRWTLVNKAIWQRSWAPRSHFVKIQHSLENRGAVLLPWEAMAEFGEDVQLFATPPRLWASKAPVTVMEIQEMASSTGKNIVVCHNIMFPIQLYYCHFVTGTKVVQASLAAADGSIIKAMAICHLDTSMWLSRHPGVCCIKNPKRGRGMSLQRAERPRVGSYP